jgi:hypothetical protein
MDYRAMFYRYDIMTATPVKADLKSFRRIQALELNSAAIAPLLRRGYHRPNPGRVHADFADQKILKYPFFPGALILIRQMLPLAPPALSEYRTYRRSAIFRRSYQPLRPSLHIAFFLADDPALYAIPGGSIRHKHHLALIMTETVTTIGKGFDKKIVY